MIVIGFIILIVLLLFEISLFLYGNYRRNYLSGKCPSWMRGCSFAHKGIHGDVNTDENSLRAFQKAIESGYAIEFDLRYTKDMVPIVSHDNDLTEEVGKKVKLSEITYEQAKELTFVKSGDKLSSLQDVLAYVDGKVPLLVEIKAYHVPGEFEKNIVELLTNYNGEYVIQSYNPFSLKYIKELNPNITIGLLFDDIPGLPIGKRVRILKDNLFLSICHPAFICYNASLVESHELDVYRSEDNMVLGFLFSEEDLFSNNFTDKVDGIVFERSRK